MAIYHLAVSAFLLVVTLNVAMNWGVFVAPRRRDPAAWPTTGVPLVSVLIPARNEAARISPCLASLLRQDYARFEVLVLDDHSEDATADVVLALGCSRDPDAPRRLLTGSPLPPGWTGKAWACQQLAAAARGDYLLFTDADTVHDPGSLAACLGHALDTDAALLSAWPRQITRTWSEHAVIPLVYVLLLGALPHRMLHRLQRHLHYARWTSTRMLASMGAANGQYMLFRRDAYEAIGGHAAVRDHLVEDVALGRLVAGRTASGMRLINCDGSGWVQCRMYTSFLEVWEGFTKNLRAAFSQSSLSFWIFGAVGTCGLFLPFVFACVPAVSGRWWWVPVVQVVWIYLLRFIMGWRFRTSLLGTILHPLGEGLSLLIGLNSWRLSSQRGVRWKGRLYRMSNMEPVNDAEGPVPPSRAQEPIS